MSIPVHFPWLPGYIDVMQTVLLMLTMTGLFPDRPCVISLILATTTKSWRLHPCPTKLQGQDLCPSVSRRWSPCPSEPGGQRIKPKRIILKFEDPIGFALYFGLFFRMGMSIPCLSHCSIWEAHISSGSSGSQLERNLLQDESRLESHPHLI